MTPRERAVAWAADVAADPSTVFLDTETTGLGVEAEICDIAIVAIDGTVVLDTLVWPLREIPREATAVHGISTADVIDQPQWDDIAPLVREMTRDRRVVIYNAAYDAQIVNQCCVAIGMEPIAWDWQCAMKAYSEYDGTLSARTTRSGFKWHKLNDAAAALGIDNPGAHRALADTETTRRLVLAMAALSSPRVDGDRPLVQELLPGIARYRDD